jgi:hypothetical protein
MTLKTMNGNASMPTAQGLNDNNSMTVVQREVVQRLNPQKGFKGK